MESSLRLWNDLRRVGPDDQRRTLDQQLLRAHSGANERMETVDALARHRLVLGANLAPRAARRFAIISGGDGNARRGWRSEYGNRLYIALRVHRGAGC